MPLVFSYGWQRNPPRLLRMLGIGERIRTSAEEERFLAHLGSLSNSLRGLCLVMGGFMDGILGKAYAILPLLPAEVLQNFDIYYREHDEDDAARRILLAYGAVRRPVLIIGHSWGGSTCVCDVLARPFARTVFVAALLTLDPVGLRPPLPLTQVRRWCNIYVDYRRASWSRQNNIARIGKPWGSIPYATENHVFSGASHPDAAGMFRERGSAFLSDVLSPWG